MQSNRLRLDDQLCFALFAATNAVTRFYKPLLDQVGLTYPQYLVMLVLWQDGDRTPDVIAERLNLPISAVAPLLDRLEESGLISRRMSADGTSVDISLTECGTILEQAASRAQQTVACQVGLEQQELAALRDDLNTIVDRMSADVRHYNDLKMLDED